MTSIHDALEKEELDDLKPNTDEMFRNTKRATMWYNEATLTAALIFVKAAAESDAFRESFMTGQNEQYWRSVMERETPEKYDDLMDIGLSGFQGKHAEQLARHDLRGEAKPLYSYDSSE